MPIIASFVGEIAGLAAKVVGGAVTSLEGAVSTVAKDVGTVLDTTSGLNLLSGGKQFNQGDIDGKEGTGSGTTSFNKNTTDNGNIDDPDTEEPKHHKDHKHPKSDDPDHKKDSTKNTTFSFE